MSIAIRAVIIDDHPLLRSGVAHALNCNDQFEVVGQGATAQDAQQMAGELGPEIMLLDVNIPGGGIAACKAIHSTHPTIKIAMFTVSEESGNVLKSLRAGAQGYILKGIGARHLRDILKDLHDGHSYVPPAMAAQMLSNNRQSLAHRQHHENFVTQLTAREEQVLAGIAKGLTNREIGSGLDLSEKTVKHYVTNVLQKLHARNRVEAALLARDHVEELAL